MRFRPVTHLNRIAIISRGSNDSEYLLKGEAIAAFAVHLVRDRISCRQSASGIYGYDHMSKGNGVSSMKHLDPKTGL